MFPSMQGELIIYFIFLWERKRQFLLIHLFILFFSLRNSRTLIWNIYWPVKDRNINVALLHALAL